jgi:catechol 2,3-dioxygenase-like lactoylglutathione lyase family enzyme
MATIEVLGFNHTNFTVSDLDRAITFFTEGLGFELLSRAPRSPKLIARMTALPEPEMEVAFVQGPGHRIELIEYRAPTPGRVEGRLCDAGAAHLALDVPDVGAAVEAAARYGFTLVGEVIAIDDGPNKGREVCYLQDRDGVTIEFIGRPQAA